MDGFIHAHPLAAIAVFTLLTVGVFVWAVFDGAEPAPDDIQQGGDWQWPEREVV